MRRYLVAYLLLSLLLLSGCGQEKTEDSTQANCDTEVTLSTECNGWLGKQAYEKYCAGCHDEGLDGAPRTGDRAAWEGRSWLWEAVLFEHARTGYETMPAKGGAETMDDATITKAAEYMMTLTYPELSQGY